jgi:hypothetical protein
MLVQFGMLWSRGMNSRDFEIRSMSESNFALEIQFSNYACLFSELHYDVEFMLLLFRTLMQW